MRRFRWRERELPRPRELTVHELEIDGGWVAVSDAKVTVEFTDNRNRRVEFTGRVYGVDIKTINEFTQYVQPDGSQHVRALPVSFGLREFLSEDFEWRYV